MDDQGTNRAGGAGVTRRPLSRFRIGIRLMLLFVTLFFVLFAYYRVRREMRREKLTSEISDLQHEVNVLSAVRKSDPGTYDPDRDTHERDLFDQIKLKQKQLDDNRY